jgi:nucleoside-diphosphate-sugar epimerase
VSRILVTGINSPLGQAVGRKLQTEGHLVVGTVRSSKLNTRGLPADEVIPLDLESESTFTNIVGGFESFVHIASMNEGSAAALLKSTGLGMIYLIDRAKQLDIHRLVHISSMSIHGRVSAEVVDEKTSVTHSVPVGASKWATECFISNERSSIEAVSIRSPAIAGPYANRHFLAKIFLNMVRGTGKISLSNPDHLFNNIVHETLIADFIVAILDNESLPIYRAVPIGSTDPIPLREIIEIMAKATSYRGQINWVEPKTPPFRIDSTGAIELGYKPITTTETINRWMHDAKH